MKLDHTIIEQLKTVFEKIENQVSIVSYQSDHAKQQELLEMLDQVAATSKLIEHKKTELTSSAPSFYLEYKSVKNGVSFKGIPGGHEFSSLILGLLNSDLKGKIPDEQIVNRIRSIQGPIRLKTYISLDCENCPGVIQALNLMAILHNDFEHQMVDGEFEQEEIKRLNVQGVPCVISGEEMISSGKASLIELIEKLEKHFGKNATKETVPKDLGLFDVAVLGGGPAGVSSAIYSARKGLKTVIIAERMGGQLQDTKGIENFISVPYVEGPQLSESLSKHLSDYGIQVLEHRRVEAVKSGHPHLVELSTGESLTVNSLIVATGAKWRELNVPGEKEYLGRGVAFCPHCDGPYYKGKDIAVIGGGNSGVEAAIDLAGIVKSVTVLEYGDSYKADQVLVDKAKSTNNITMLTSAQTQEILGDNDKVTGLKYLDRANDKEKTVQLDGVFVQIGLVPNSQFLKGVVEMNNYGEILIDGKGKTNIDKIYAAGDVTNVPYKQIIIAMGEGSKAALAAFEDHMIA